MAANLGGAEEYIELNVINLDDWAEADEAKKQRLLTVAERTLIGLYDGYTIPDNAVYEYAAVLATVFNDNGMLKRQGVAGFSVTGVGSFTFANAGSPSDDIARFIPKAATDIINASNVGRPTVGGRVRWTVL
ncbi:hypothetical protein [Paenibacillus planticolens]|uniref:Uncharacterized protein n=1 Tax=Paenibacillus planticolens TaxID=2654976 RepID=A0ABX1ZEG0_9BACL|nr:hypothetical protein [Paenibacillus planticolens]NOU98479.1 hypothetical protein [Paenibacillus planticolens]